MPATNDDDDTTPADATSQVTPEQRLWRALRGRRLNDRKFRRAYTVDAPAGAAADPVRVDFACLEAGVAIDLVGPATPKLTAEKGRALKAAKLKLLRVPEADVLGRFEKTLQLIWRETEQTVKRRPAK